ncbi:MAG TPA: hypothetical protein VMD99_04040 [Terriglobales bacterium]|nr:hypothetical protein [Terriglobales bacterium]
MACLFATSYLCCAGSISFGTLTVPSLTPAGVSFTYSGTLTQTDTLAFSQSGDPCLQSPAAYCINGAGVVVVAGTGPVGSAFTFSGTFGPTTGTWDSGALLIEISGVATEQIFPADAANGLGSSTPPLGLTLPSTTLSALGFPSFSVVNPTITFLARRQLISRQYRRVYADSSSRAGDALGRWSCAAFYRADAGFAARTRRTIAFTPVPNARAAPGAFAPVFSLTTGEAVMKKSKLLLASLPLSPHGSTWCCSARD